MPNKPLQTTTPLTFLSKFLSNFIDGSNVSDLLLEVGLKLRPLGRPTGHRQVLDVARSRDQVRVLDMWVIWTA